MENRLWLFNPENDIALARGDANFTPPPAALELRRAGQLLPLFLAEGADRVAVDGVNKQWLDAFRREFNISADIWNHSVQGMTPMPWGWSTAVRRYFSRLGFPDSSLPSDTQLALWRELSHRRTAAAVGKRLATTAPLSMWPAAVEASSADELRSLLAHIGKAVVKQPWSSSGRGVRIFDPARCTVDRFVEQTAGTINKQGSVMVERFMEGHRDFALLYTTANGRAQFCGPSVFSAGTGGNYIGNIVADSDRLLQTLAEIAGGGDTLRNLIDGLAETLSSLVAPFYSGPLGVDICANGECVHLCEINLRFTMGFVAQAIAKTSVPGTPPCHLMLTSAPLPSDKRLTPPGANLSFVLRS